MYPRLRVINMVLLRQDVWCAAVTRPPRLWITPWPVTDLRAHHGPILGVKDQARVGTPTEKED